MSQSDFLNNFSNNTENISPNNNFSLPITANDKLNETNKKKLCKFITKKRGRMNKSLFSKKNVNGENQLDTQKKVHNKFSSDNVRRRIKVLFNKYIINLLNKLVKKNWFSIKMKFLKMDFKFSKNIGIEFNRNLLEKKIKDIIINISHKYKNKKNNLNCIKFIETHKNNEEILEILNMSYKDLYNYYLKSTKNNSLVTSFEENKENLLNLYGKEYLDKFVKISENFVPFFTNTKNRKSRKIRELDIINIPVENDLETASNSNGIMNDENKQTQKINMVSSSTQTDISDINSKIIVFS